MWDDLARVYASLIVGWVNAFYAILACWVVLGRGWWFPRAATLCGALFALLLLRTYDYERAYDLYVPFALRSGLIIVSLLAWQAVAYLWQRRTRESKWASRFSLRDALLAIPLAAAIFATLRPAIDQASYMRFDDYFRNAIFVAAALSAVWLLAVQSWWLREWPAPLVVCLANGVNRSPFAFLELGERSPISGLVELVAIVLVAIWLLSSAGAGWIDLQRLVSTAPSFGPTRYRRHAAIAATALILIPSLALFVAMAPSPKPAVAESDTSIVEPLLKLGKKLPPINVNHRATPREIETYAVDHAALLKEALALLETGKPVLRPLQWNGSDFLGFEASRRNRLTEGLRVYGQAKAMQGDTDAATEIFWQLARYGRDFRKRILVDAMIGRRYDWMAFFELAQLAPRLSGEERARVRDEVVDQLQEGSAEELIVEAELKWIGAAQGWVGRLNDVVHFPFTGSREYYLQRAREIERSRTARLRLLLLTLALEDFRAEQGRYPESLAELMPEHFDAVPLDPFSEQSFVYESERDAYRLFSVGNDGVDDRSRAAPASAGETRDNDISLQPGTTRIAP